MSAMPEPIRATFLLAAAWYGLFALPLFLFTPDAKGKKETLGRAIRLGVRAAEKFHSTPLSL